MIDDRSAHAKDAGFTLVETIVAFAVLSVTLAVAIKSISTSLHHSERARIQNEIRQIARTVLTEQTGSVETTGTNGAYVWELHTQPLSDETAPGLASVTLDIRHMVPPVLETRYITFRQSD